MNPAAVISIIAEYNPFHKGHQYQLSQVRQKFPDAPVIAVSSGSLTQRGEAPIWDKWKRTRLALLGGVDLVLELPVVYSLQSAREFARGAVACLQATGVVTHLSFGCETPNLALLERLAKEQPAKVQWEAALSQGLSYAKAAEQVYGRLNPRYPALLQGSNNLLALEYLRAIGSLAPQLQPLPVLRQGSAYGSTTLEDTLASASALRKALKRDGLTPRAAQQFPEAELPWIRTWLAQGLCGLPEDRLSLLLSYTLECSSPAAIRTACLTSEGLEDLVYKHRRAGSFTALVEACATRRYSPSRIRRLLWQLLLSQPDCTFSQGANAAPTYLRVLGFSPRGQELLRQLKQKAQLPLVLQVNKNTLAKAPSAAFAAQLALDLRAANLYQLLQTGTITDLDYRLPPVRL